MAESGLLPDPSLVWFLSHLELGQLCLQRRPGLVRKAGRRRQLFPGWDGRKFAELEVGSPASLEERQGRRGAATRDSGGERAGLRLRGTPACPGCVVAPARVVTSISQAEKIRPGDILVTSSTGQSAVTVARWWRHNINTRCSDIGWSPYFPILAGVITELGGLISHGAVVAREYGLPCLVGAETATELFQDGETLCLDATQGVVVRLDQTVERNPC